MKLCIIGNSHCAALNDAWKTMAADHPGVQITCFAAPRGQATQVALKKQRLVAKNEGLRAFFRVSSGGQDEIALADYDRFLIYGMFVQPPVDHDDAPYSRAVLAAARQGRVRRSHAFRLVELLRKATEAPIDVGPNPYRLPTPEVTPVTFAKGGEAEHRAFAKIWAKTLNARYVRQPQETVLTGRTTRPEFGKAARRLSATPEAKNFHDDDENERHVNADYGRIWLTAYLAGLLENTPAEA